jgi:hypothetical protein
MPIHRRLLLTLEAFRLRRGVNMEAKDPKALPVAPAPEPEKPMKADDEDEEDEEDEGEDDDPDEADDDGDEEDEDEDGDDDEEKEGEPTTDPTPKDPVDPKDVTEYVAIKPRAIPNYAVTDDSSVVVSSVQHEFQMSMAENHFSSTSFEIGMWVCDLVPTDDY